MSTNEFNEVNGIAARVRTELGLSEPPVSAVDALSAFQLSLPDVPLENILAEAGLDPSIIGAIDAMLDLGDKCVFVRDELHSRQKNWGYLHELAHHLIPWHRDLLYRCSIFNLPKRLQKQFEREADHFAAEMFFFGQRFTAEALDGPFGLETVRQLATERFDVSLHSAFMRFAEENPKSCCLIISRPQLDEGGMFQGLRTRQYLKSKSFHARIPINQLLPPDSGLGHLYSTGSLDSVVDHKIRINGAMTREYEANSFTNGYDVFTLLWKP